jgi:DNA-directed RNA polymerase specialized sigma24 family protein
MTTPKKTVADYLPVEEIQKLIYSAFIKHKGFHQCKQLQITEEDAIQDIWVKLLKSHYDPSKSAVSSFIYLVTASYFINSQTKSRSQLGMTLFLSSSFEDISYQPSVMPKEID